MSSIFSPKSSASISAVPWTEWHKPKVLISGNELLIAIMFEHIGFTYWSHKALGQISIISFAISNKTGIVRNPLIMPPMPSVSAIVCFKPNSSGISKSIIVEGLYPPTWIVDWIKSASLSASFLSVKDSIVGLAPSFCATALINSCDILSLSSFISIRAICIVLKLSIVSKSVTIFFVKTELPAPIIVSLII